MFVSGWGISRHARFLFIIIIIIFFFFIFFIILILSYYSITTFWWYFSSYHVRSFNFPKWKQSFFLKRIYNKKFFFVGINNLNIKPILQEREFKLCLDLYIFFFIEVLFNWKSYFLVNFFSREKGGFFFSWHRVRNLFFSNKFLQNVFPIHARNRLEEKKRGCILIVHFGLIYV